MYKYDATIKYSTTEKHPDTPSATNLVFNDVYRIDTSIFGGDAVEYIKRDLALVAGGGYNTENITNVTYKITRS